MNRPKIKLSHLRFSILLDEDEKRRELFHLKQRFKSLSRRKNTRSDNNESDRLKDELRSIEREIEQLYLQIGLHGMKTTELETRKTRLQEILAMLPPQSQVYTEYYSDLVELVTVLVSKRMQLKNMSESWRRK